MLQVRQWLIGIFGQEVLNYCFKVSCVIVVIIFIFAVQRYRFNLAKFFITLSIFILAYLFANSQPYFSEKTHVFTYGLLGYLVFRDLSQNRGNNSIGIAFSLLFISFISGLDEIFQYFLSYRVGEIRDFITNIIGGFFGITLFLTRDYGILSKRV